MKARLVSSVTVERPKLENRVCSSADSILLASEVDFNVTRIVQTSCIGLSLFLTGCVISPLGDSRSPTCAGIRRDHVCGREPDVGQEADYLQQGTG